MTQLYFREKSNDSKNNPKEETIQFILNFSKSFQVKKIKSNCLIELHLN